MTTLIVMVTALLAVAAIQNAGAGDARGAAKHVVVKYANLRADSTPAPSDAYQGFARGGALRTHVARLP